MENNLDGDFGVTMKEIDLISKAFSCKNNCGLLNSKLVGADGSVSSVYCPVTDNIHIPQNSGDGDTGFYFLLLIMVFVITMHVCLWVFLIVSYMYLIIRWKWLLREYLD